MPPGDAIDVEQVLASLKRFQRRSVDYVFDRLYGEGATRRFLLADEVGLGKTLVARGVIARAIEHLRARGEKRIDVVYICSNADIARQNIRRLNVTGEEGFELASRITMLPEVVHELETKSLNFISFTPGTSFSFGHSLGQWQERVLLYWFLRWTWPELCEGAAAKNVMRGRVAAESFRSELGDAASAAEWYDERLAALFREQILAEDGKLAERAEPTRRARFEELCGWFARDRERVPDDQSQARNRFVGELRALLAATCIEALQPDLVVLDEFQRFKDLLCDDNPAGALARHLFEWGEARVLLLSATPYKMYTLAQEAETDDHYGDFVETLRFLNGDDARAARVEALLSDYGRACTRVDRDGPEALRRAKAAVEAELRRVMCRTEKLAVTADRSGMLRDADRPPLEIGPAQVRSYLETRAVADALEHRDDVLEYWKASPYLLNVMEADGYKLKERLRAASTNGGGGRVAEVIRAAPDSLLDRAAWESYGEIDPRHAALERLTADTIGGGWWRLLWLPPSFPDYELEEPFSSVDRGAMTKRLVFSAWHMVPRLISVMLSYEAERRMVKGFEPDARNTAEEHRRRRGRLAFGRSDGRLTGMPVLGLLYPSFALAELGDPKSLAVAGANGAPTLEDVLSAVEQRLVDALAPILARQPDSGPVDESWYWVAPILLDMRRNSRATAEWFANPDKLAEAWSGEEHEEATIWAEHVREAGRVARSEIWPHGRPPADLLRVLALFAAAGPGTCALRALAGELGGPEPRSEPRLRHAAARIAWGLRSLFNSPDVTALVRGLDPREPYWQRMVEYAAAGCLQSVLDEHLHLVVEAENLRALPRGDAAREAAERVASAASMRAATPGIDWVAADDGRIAIENQRVRARFAMRFGDESGETEKQGLRKEAVRAAFNSPFWPFVLATTSVGQEGLDFHHYCHAVVHWNLPSNPVDLEQREGRVHRFKGHAVRKNVARFARESGFEPSGEAPLWQQLFAHAAKRASDDSDISPYWVFTVDGGSVIERHVPTLPLSREAARLPLLRGSLAVYRMVFGQPRQDDLVEHLRRTVPEEDLARLSSELAIDLRP